MNLDTKKGDSPLEYEKSWTDLEVWVEKSIDKKNLDVIGFKRNYLHATAGPYLLSCCDCPNQTAHSRFKV